MAQLSWTGDGGRPRGRRPRGLGGPVDRLGPRDGARRAESSHLPRRLSRPRRRRGDRVGADAAAPSARRRRRAGLPGPRRPKPAPARVPPA